MGGEKREREIVRTMWTLVDTDRVVEVRPLPGAAKHNLWTPRFAFLRFGRKKI